MAKLKEIKLFLKRHTAVLLMLAVVLTMSVGTLWAKYTTDVTVTGELSLEVKAEQKYVINKSSLWNNLQRLTLTGNYTYHPEALKFVTGAEAKKYIYLAATNCENSNYMLRFSWDSSTKTMYISPNDTSDSTSVVCAPADSSNLFNAEYINTTKIESIDCSNLDTSKVTNMSGMFSGFTKLTDLNFGSRFDTSNVTDMSSMFSGDTALTSLDLICFDTSSVTNMSKMFENCSSLSKITVASDFNTGSVVNSDSMFAGCELLVGGAGTSYNSNKLDKTYARIDGGTDSPGYFTGVANWPMGLSLKLASDIFAVAADPVPDGDTVDPVGDVTEVTTEEPVVTEESGTAETPAPSEADSSSDTSEPAEELLPVTGQNEETDALDNGNS